MFIDEWKTHSILQQNSSIEEFSKGLSFMWIKQNEMDE